MVRLFAIFDDLTDAGLSLWSQVGKSTAILWNILRPNQSHEAGVLLHSELHIGVTVGSH
jgi:hypothetical protein